MVHLNASAGPHRHADVEVHAGILDVANGLLESLDTTLKAAIGLAIVAVLAVRVIANFTPVKLVSALLVGGLAVWILLLGGLETIGGLFGDEIDEAGAIPSAVVQVVDDPTVLNDDSGRL